MHLLFALCIALVAIEVAALPSWTSFLFASSDCTTKTVHADDTCGSLATKCGISAQDFNKYNKASNLCSALQPYQRICCSEGTLPDIRPKPLKNGGCATYVVQKDDTCASIAARNGLKATDIDNLNRVKTWGFNNCTKGLPKGLKICLSNGNAPMPAPVKGAVCGPTKLGTKPPPPGSKISFGDLSPCPLNACCNIWGQCGISSDFCKPTQGDFGNPGTGPPGTNGCVQNCGMDIINNEMAPERPISVGYYETWNMDRPCMQMPVRSIWELDSTYTHIHWAFGIVYQNLSVGVNDTYNQFADFVALGSGTKRIISFGGWGVSTSPDTYNLLRQAVSPKYRETFTDSVVRLVNKYMLDGVDFDWEYPGAPDIPGIPAGLSSDGENYLEMLKVIRKKLPKGKTLSIAAPASYWYLKAFPIDKMAEVLDYIVYMTYDLHGQWDYENKWSDDGCPAGNCLRSHVNITDTMLALSMITKAGVPSKKILVGVSSYGRSFKMTDPNCSGPMCTYIGPESKAKPGICTGAAGYISNAEINRIIRDGGKIKHWFDESTMTDLLVYEGTEWVAYMSEDNKAARRGRWANLNFGGTIDWAVDLQAFTYIASV
ncbi:glycoside hydrolase family 18 protein [Aplosporella prunicola CBS 121167]|uniref:chitinase n=1 Tax=Aplosporella prunicola CBS 121167 TaxID=1176127 RepID=A0A6A6B4S2_9PEZI|nr:glycoside hydrolase family 18 protein [Aplosporella prunicola CBS 121167]KAF2138204.1 glycoside hydrolase family 18 protein [Aplosporella prunicola CBS 121167]